MSKTIILRYNSDLYGTVNPLCMKINFAADQRKLMIFVSEIGFNWL